MQIVDLNHITIDTVSYPLLREKNIRLSVLRLDKVHPQVSGNKWFKLRYYLDDARLQGKSTLVTFGGAWSNHILATAAASRMSGFKSIGIIRGEEPAVLSSTLVMARQLGMHLHFSNRSDYKKEQVPAEWRREEYYIIPEGGYGVLGARGAATMLDTCQKEEYTHLCCAVGTGTMMAGLLQAALPSQQLTGISILKNNTALAAEISSLLPEEKAFDLLHDYHFGGYAKHTTELLQFMNGYYSLTNIPSDFVYTGKLFFAVVDLIRNNYFSSDSRLLVIHSGGLQGNDSLKKGTLIF